MYKDYRYINAGENEVYRYGKKAQSKVKAAMVANKGYYSIAADGGRYWTIGTSEGKFGEFAKFQDNFFSVNSAGYVYAKAETEKGSKFLKMLERMLEKMVQLNDERLKNCNAYNDEEEDDECDC